MGDAASDEAFERAARFVGERGDPTQVRVAHALLGRVGAGEVASGLKPDAEDPASLGRALGICDDLRALSGAHVKDWVGACAKLQAVDGSFGRETRLEERLFETGMLAGHLAKTRYVRPEVLEGASDFLVRHWTPDRVRAGSWWAIAANAHLFANTAHDEADAILQWCGRELGRAFITRAFDAVRTARVLVYCDAHGLPGAELRAPDLLVALWSEQRGDGSYAGWEGEGARDEVASTLDAMVAMRRLSG